MYPVDSSIEDKRQTLPKIKEINPTYIANDRNGFMYQTEETDLCSK